MDKTGKRSACKLKKKNTSESSPVFGRIFLLFLVFFPLVLVSNDVRYKLEGTLCDGHNLLNGLELFFRGVNSCMLCHHVTIVGRIRAAWGLKSNRQQDAMIMLIQKDLNGNYFVPLYVKCANNGLVCVYFIFIYR